MPRAKGNLRPSQKRLNNTASARQPFSSWSVLANMCVSAIQLLSRRLPLQTSLSTLWAMSSGSPHPNAIQLHPRPQELEEPAASKTDRNRNRYGDGDRDPEQPTSTQIPSILATSHTCVPGLQGGLDGRLERSRSRGRHFSDRCRGLECRSPNHCAKCDPRTSTAGSSNPQPDLTGPGQHHSRLL